MPAPSSVRGQIFSIAILVTVLLVLLLNRERCARGIAGTFEVMSAPTSDAGARDAGAVDASRLPPPRKVDPNAGRRAAPPPGDGGAPLGAPVEQ